MSSGNSRGETRRPRSPDSNRTRLIMLFDFHLILGANSPRCSNNHFVGHDRHALRLKLAFRRLIEPQFRATHSLISAGSFDTDGPMNALEASAVFQFAAPLIPERCRERFLRAVVRSARPIDRNTGCLVPED